MTTQEAAQPAPQVLLPHVQPLGRSWAAQEPDRRPHQRSLPRGITDEELARPRFMRDAAAIVLVVILDVGTVRGARSSTERRGQRRPGQLEAAHHLDPLPVAHRGDRRGRLPAQASHLAGLPLESFEDGQRRDRQRGQDEQECHSPIGFKREANRSDVAVRPHRVTSGTAKPDASTRRSALSSDRQGRSQASGEAHPLVAHQHRSTVERDSPQRDLDVPPAGRRLRGIDAADEEPAVAGGQLCEQRRRHHPLSRRR